LWGQSGEAQSLPQTTEEALHDMAQLAAVIFAGQVVAVHRHAAAGGSAGVVDIEFAVQDAVLGVSGGSYTLREWAGLWPADDEPFRVGRQYLMLLHSPGAAGLSSPIGGMDGAIPIRGGGQTVDLSWVGTRVVTPTAYQQVALGKPIMRPMPVHADSGGAASEDAVGLQSAGNLPASSGSQSAAYATVLSMLRGWEKSDHAAR
jgi:hypothetical protein